MGFLTFNPWTMSRLGTKINGLKVSLICKPIIITFHDDIVFVVPVGPDPQEGFNAELEVGFAEPQHYWKRFQICFGRW